jgi:hypothetical protein
MLKHGWVFARWVPNLALGYGYPFFNYREPVPYIAGELLALIEIPIPLVLGLIYSASLLSGAIGAGALADDLWGGWAGWVASVSYGLGPYVLLDALRRGNMPESVALAILPWLFLSVRRLILYGRRHAFVASILLLTGLFLSHNISSLLLFPFLGLYTVALSVIHRRRGHWPRAFLAVGLAVLIAAWFWLPALAEQDFVQLHLSRTTRNNDFHFNFVTWREMLLTPPLSYDPDYLNPPMRVPLGIGAGLLGLLGLGWILWRGSFARRWLALLFGGIAVGYLWLATASSEAVWETLPLLPFVQFPWRLVGRALLPVSLLAGAVVGDDALTLFPHQSSQLSSRMGGYVTLILVVGLTVLAWPRTFPPKGVCAEKPYPTIEDVYEYERAGWIGIDPESSYFPVWVENHPNRTHLAEAFSRGELPNRLDTASLPDGATIDEAVYRPLRASIMLSTPDAFQARWLGLYFPGWKVTIDGEPIAVTPEEDSGFLTFPVSAGNHQLEVWFGATVTRTLAVLLTGVGLLGGIGSLFIIDWPSLQEERYATDELRADRTTLAIWVGVVSGLTIIRLLIGQSGAAIPRARVGAARRPEGLIPTAHVYDAGLDLIGTRLNTDTLAGDEEMRVDLLWAARAVPSEDYRTSVLLVGKEGRTWSPAGTLRPRGYEPPPPTTMWRPGEFAFDPHVVFALPGTPPGTYDVVVSIFDRDTLEPATLIGSQGEPLGTELVLGEVEIVRPSEPYSLADFQVSVSEPSGVCEEITLWSMSLDRNTSTPGGLVGVRWVWESERVPSQAYLASLSLIGPGGSMRDTWVLPLVAKWWPTDRWQVGDRWLGQHVIRLPGGLETGRYTFQTKVKDCADPLTLASIEIEAPNRRWVVPVDFTETDITFGDRIRLVGYELKTNDARDGETIKVSLAWQAVTELETSYRIFVHLLDSNGRMVDQSDGVPVSWTRPTTGWAVSEVVVESRSVTMPETLGSNAYTIQVGVYHEDGTRLATDLGEDSIIVETLTPVGEP